MPDKLLRQPFHLQGLQVLFLTEGGAKGEGVQKERRRVGFFMSTV